MYLYKNKRAVMKRILTILLILATTSTQAAVPTPVDTQRKTRCSDTIFYKDGTTEVMTFKRQNRSKVFYKTCHSDLSVGRSVPIENIDKVVLSSGEIVLPGKTYKKERNIFVKILIVLGIGIGVIAVGFGLIILLYAIAQPW